MVTQTNLFRGSLTFNAEHYDDMEVGQTALSVNVNEDEDEDEDDAGPAGVAGVAGVNIDLNEDDDDDGSGDDPYCGDNIVQDPPEECDPPGSTVMFSDGSSAVCDANCQIPGETNGDSCESCNICLTKAAEYDNGIIELWFKGDGSHNVKVEVNKKQVKVEQKTTADGKIYYNAYIPTDKRNSVGGMPPFTSGEKGITIYVDGVKTAVLGYFPRFDVTGDNAVTLWDMSDIIRHLVFEAKTATVIKAVSNFVTTISE